MFGLKKLAAGFLFVCTMGMAASVTSHAQAPQSKFAEVNGFRMHYLVVGSGDPVVLLHGFGERQSHVAAAHH